MSIRNVGRCILFVGFCSFGIGAACGQEYPNRPIRMVTGSAGGGQDFAARVIAQGITGSLGQQFVIENKGGNAAIAAEIITRAPADGYTLLVTSDPHWLLPFMRENLSYDPVKDFAPITLAVRVPNLVVIHPSVPANSISELVALAKAKPDSLNYASSGTGASTQLTAELFKSMAGINITRVSYKGGGPAAAAVLSNEVQVWFPNSAEAAPHVKAGRVRALAVTTLQPSALFPGLPTVASVVPGFESISIIGVVAHIGTPQPIINRLNREMVRMLNTADAREKFMSAGAEVVASSPEEYAAAAKVEMTKWGKLIKDQGIRDE